MTPVRKTVSVLLLPAGTAGRTNGRRLISMQISERMPAARIRGWYVQPIPEMKEPGLM